MSLCNLGRPVRDAAVQNLTVNDTLRSNKLLKATKAEIDRLCTQLEEVKKEGKILFIGSMRFIVQLQNFLPNETDFYNLPSGTRAIQGNYNIIVSPDVETSLYTDIDLVIQKFQATVSTAASSPMAEHNINVSIHAGTTPSSLSNLLTLSLLNTNGVDVRETDTSASVIIPAGSYYSIVIRSIQPNPETPANITSLNAAWTLDLNPRV